MGGVEGDGLVPGGTGGRRDRLVLLVLLLVVVVVLVLYPVGWWVGDGWS